ncbi:MAG: hypothetical protein ACJ8IK_30640 [Burkholderiaceae bacterium]
MKAEQLQLALRPRPAYEAVDLGVEMTQRSGRSLLRAYLPFALLLLVACGATIEIARWLPSLLLWWCLPWLDRTLLDIYARQAFGDTTTFADAWEARRRAPWPPMLGWLTLWRLSWWRAYSMPVGQLEGQTGSARRQRVKAILRAHRGAAAMMQGTFSTIVLCLAAGLVALIPWMTPGLHPFGDIEWLGDDSTATQLLLYLAYAGAVLFIEPFFVAAGFAMYLNRRVELEAWDVEQDLRHAFER